MPTISADHTYYVDLSEDSTFPISNMVSVFPEELAFDDQIRGDGNISFQLSYSAKDQDGNLAVSARDFIGPYRSYYRLRYGNIAIMAGVIVKTNSKYGSDFMSVFGKTWEHLPARWEYPFDPRGDVNIISDPVNNFVFPNSFQNDELVGSGVQTPTGLVYQCYNRDLISIFSDIFAVTMSGVPHRVTFDISTLASLSGLKTNYQFSLGDTTKMDSFINGLAETGNGFDWWVGHDKKLHWASPFRFGNPATAYLFYTLDDTDIDNGFLLEPEFTNNGPRATHVFGSGTGLASQTKLGRAYGYAAAQAQFSRLDESYDFGDVRNVNQIIAKTQRQLSLDLNPEHEIPINVDPMGYPAGPAQYWKDFRKGRAVWLTLDMGYHLIDSAQQLRSYNATITKEGTAEVAWTLQQIYDTSLDLGTVEG